MGIPLCSAQFLKSERRRGVTFSRLLTLGRQSIYMEEEEYRDVLSALGVNARECQYSDDLFRALGAMSIDVMDVSKYEGANLIHDLNLPIDPQFHRRYDCVFDGGALEHVFNFPAALKSCMEMVDVGGHFITTVPGNNYCGHGFYQFSPELFFNTLSVENGFQVERLLFTHRGRWYAVKNPKEVKSRVELFTDEYTLFFLSAKRVEAKEIFRTWPQQSDYVAHWDAQPASVPSANGTKESLIRALPFLRDLQTRWRAYKSFQRASPSNRDWFTPIDLDAPEIEG